MVSHLYFCGMHVSKMSCFCRTYNLLLNVCTHTLGSHGVVYNEHLHEVDKNDGKEFLRCIFYLACSLGQRRSLRGFRWMNCSHCGTSGGCGLGLREQKDHQFIIYANRI